MQIKAHARHSLCSLRQNNARLFAHHHRNYHLWYFVVVVVFCERILFTVSSGWYRPAAIYGVMNECVCHSVTIDYAEDSEMYCICVWDAKHYYNWIIAGYAISSSVCDVSISFRIFRLFKLCWVLLTFLKGLIIVCTDWVVRIHTSIAGNYFERITRD